MNRILLSVFAVGLLFAVGHALQCYNCEFGLGSLCFTSVKTCPAGEMCFSGAGKAAGFVEYKVKGCLPASECNTLSVFQYLNITLNNINRTCCGTDLCNGAPGHRQLTPLTLMLVSLTGAVAAGTVF